MSLVRAGPRGGPAGRFRRTREAFLPTPSRRRGPRLPPRLRRVGLHAGRSTRGHVRPPGSSAPAPGSDAYVYADPAGITAELTLDTSGATLTIENATGRALARPGVYVLDARDGRRVAWTVVAAAPIPDGATAEFAVERPASPEDKHIGLAALLFGGEDHGAFVPPHPAQEAA